MGKRSTEGSVIFLLDTPRTRYTQSRNGRVAYQQFGRGSLELLVMPGSFNHLDFMWSDPGYAQFLRQLGSFARVVVFDRVGVGLSDPLSHIPPLEERVWDVEAVLDAVGYRDVALLALSENAAVAAYYAAAHPERVRAIVFAGAIIKGVEEGVPWALPAQTFSELRGMAERWGEGSSLDYIAPSVAGSRSIRRLWSAFERAVASPTVIEAFIDFIWDLDVTSAIACIDVATLVVARRGDRVVPVAQARKLADFIDGARYVELEGEDHVPWFGDLDSYLNPIESFLTGDVTARESKESMVTMLFTDIVGSTSQLSQAGDQAWANRIERHDAIGQETIIKHEGLEVERTGDGFLAVFPGPLKAVRCALEMMESVRALDISLRAGVHIGPVVVLNRYNIQGIAVNTCARICSAAGANQVLASQAARHLIGRAVSAESVGLRHLKGVGMQELYQVGLLPYARTLDSAHPRSGLLDSLVLATVRHAPFAARAAMRLLRHGASRRSVSTHPVF